jgi:hypothetical protein
MRGHHGLLGRMTTQLFAGRFEMLECASEVDFVEDWVG